MAYIRTVAPEDAGDDLRELYEQDVQVMGYVPNYSRAMSLRPKAIAAWRQLLRSFRSHMPLRRYELVTIAAAITLKCTY